MKWWGWGDPKVNSRLSEAGIAMLRERFGDVGDAQPPVALDDVQIGEPRLAGRARELLSAAVGDQHVRDDRLTRVAHAAGKSYPDLLRQRAGDCEQAPDAVVSPASHEEVHAVLEAAAAEEVAVVPFGGGTSVVGGVEPLRGRFEAVVALDLGRMRRLVDLDPTSLTAVLDPGLRGPEAEEALHRHGLTLGHYPQSYEYATIGGYAATRSAGQASTGYGRFDDLVLGLRAASPNGDVDLPPRPASAAGPDLRELWVGSEGTLGVITQVAVSVRPRPEAVRYEAFAFDSFERGTRALRELEQEEVSPDVARLSDEEETQVSLAMAGLSGWQASAGRLYLRARGRQDGCLAIAGWEGSAEDVDRRRARSLTVLRRNGALALGARPAKGWLRSRFESPYLRDDMIERGLLVETLETAGQWSDLAGLHAAVRSALNYSLGADGPPPLVLCHISHLYPSGASLYFTWIAPQRRGQEMEQWRSAKHAAGEAILSAGGTITHHHAVGRDHVPWMSREIGATGVAALRALKAELDPTGILNPGKLLPDAPA